MSSNSTVNAAMSEEQILSEVADGKNARSIKCKYCTSVMLKPSSADFQQQEYDLPTVTQNVKNTSTETEKINAFWKVDDMFTFDNIGFSNTVGNTKYLACADCDAGPVGYHDISSKISYVALSRVNYV